MEYESSGPNPPSGFSAFGEWFSLVFRLWAAQAGVWILQGLLVVVFLSVVIVPIYVMLFMTAYRGGDMLSTMPLIVGLSLLILVIWSFLLPGMLYTGVKQLRGQAIGVSDLFAGGRFFLPILLINLIPFGLEIINEAIQFSVQRMNQVSGGMLSIVVSLLFIPVQLFVTTVLFLAYPLVVAQNRRVGEAIALSWRTAFSNFWFYLVFSVVLSFLSGMGLLACCIGIIASVAFHPLAQVVAYFGTFSAEPRMSPSAAPGPMPPPYNPGV